MAFDTEIGKMTPQRFHLKRLFMKLFIYLFLIAACPLAAHLSEEDAIERLNYIHSQLSLTHGSFLEEYPEQVMSAMFISCNPTIPSQ